MPRHDDTASMQQMLSHAREAAQLGCEHNRADLDVNRMLGLALLQLLLILGESAARVSSARRERCPAIPWSQVIALRNRLIHGYDTIDFDILWKVVTADLPPLISALECELASSES